MPESPDVDAVLVSRAHPLPSTIGAIRAVLLAVPDVVESVKWNSPNYALRDDFATLSMRRDAAVQVVLHTGAKPKPEHPQIVIDPLPGFAKWADRNRAVLTFTADGLSEHELGELRRVVAAWVDQLE